MKKAEFKISGLKRIDQTARIAVQCQKHEEKEKYLTISATKMLRHCQFQVFLIANVHQHSFPIRKKKKKYSITLQKDNAKISTKKI